MPLGLACALGAALAYGCGSVLQAAAAAATRSAERLDPRLLLTLLRGWRYPVGLALDGLGFLLSLVALRTLPLYVVQSVVSGFLAVTALVGVVVLGLRLQRREVAALGAVIVGLALVGLSAAPASARAPGSGGQWLLLGVAVALVALAVPLATVDGRSGAWLLGTVGGLAFGVVAVAARVLAPDGVAAGALLAAPASYALLVAAPLGLTAYAAALQRGSVVEATAPLVVAETLLPAIAGLAWLGDHPRPGWGVLAVVGFVLAVGAAVLLSRFGEIEPVPSGGSQEAAL